MNRTNFTIAIGILATALISIGLAKGQNVAQRASNESANKGTTAADEQPQSRLRQQDAKRKGARDHVAWVAKCLEDFQVIKVGMTREDVQKRFPMDGGLHSVSPVRFTHPECRYFKIDVEFSFKRNSEDMNRAIISPDDKATKVSKPYIERPYID